MTGTPLEIAKAIIEALEQNAYMQTPMDEAAYELVAKIISEWMPSVKRQEAVDV